MRKKKKPTKKELQERLKQYRKTYYEKHRKQILENAKKTYFKTGKKTPKCKVCGKKLPKELSANTKYCEKCLYAKGHGADAHRMAAARYWRKKHLTKKGKSK